MLLSSSKIIIITIVMMLFVANTVMTSAVVIDETVVTNMSSSPTTVSPSSSSQPLSTLPPSTTAPELPVKDAFKMIGGVYTTSYKGLMTPYGIVTPTSTSGEQTFFVNHDPAGANTFVSSLSVHDSSITSKGEDFFSVPDYSIGFTYKEYVYALNLDTINGGSDATVQAYNSITQQHSAYGTEVTIMGTGIADDYIVLLSKSSPIKVFRLFANLSLPATMNAFPAITLTVSKSSVSPSSSCTDQNSPANSSGNSLINGFWNLALVTPDDRFVFFAVLSSNLNVYLFKVQVLPTLQQVGYLLLDDDVVHDSSSLSTKKQFMGAAIVSSPSSDYILDFVILVRETNGDASVWRYNGAVSNPAQFMNSCSPGKYFNFPSAVTKKDTILSSAEHGPTLCSPVPIAHREQDEKAYEPGCPFTSIGEYFFIIVYDKPNNTFSAFRADINNLTVAGGIELPLATYYDTKLLPYLYHMSQLYTDPYSNEVFFFMQEFTPYVLTRIWYQTQIIRFDAGIRKPTTTSTTTTTTTVTSGSTTLTSAPSASPMKIIGDPALVNGLANFRALALVRNPSHRTSNVCENPYAFLVKDPSGHENQAAIMELTGGPPLDKFLEITGVVYGVAVFPSNDQLFGFYYNNYQKTRSVIRVDLDGNAAPLDGQGQVGAGVSFSNTSEFILLVFSADTTSPGVRKYRQNYSSPEEPPVAYLPLPWLSKASPFGLTDNVQFAYFVVGNATGNFYLIKVNAAVGGDTRSNTMDLMTIRTLLREDEVTGSTDFVGMSYFENAMDQSYTPMIAVVYDLPLNGTTVMTIDASGTGLGERTIVTTNTGAGSDCNVDEGCPFAAVDEFVFFANQESGIWTMTRVNTLTGEVQDNLQIPNVFGKNGAHPDGWGEMQPVTLVVDECGMIYWFAVFYQPIINRQSGVVRIDSGVKPYATKVATTLEPSTTFATNATTSTSAAPTSSTMMTTTVSSTTETHTPSSSPASSTSSASQSPAPPPPPSTTTSATTTIMTNAPSTLLSTTSTQQTATSTSTVTPTTTTPSPSGSNNHHNSGVNNNSAAAPASNTITIAAGAGGGALLIIAIIVGVFWYYGLFCFQSKRRQGEDKNGGGGGRRGRGRSVHQIQKHIFMDDQESLGQPLRSEQSYAERDRDVMNVGDDAMSVGSDEDDGGGIIPGAASNNNNNNGQGNQKYFAVSASSSQLSPAESPLNRRRSSSANNNGMYSPPASDSDIMRTASGNNNGNNNYNDNNDGRRLSKMSINARQTKSFRNDDNNNNGEYYDDEDNNNNNNNNMDDSLASSQAANLSRGTRVHRGDNSNSNDNTRRTPRTANVNDLSAGSNNNNNNNMGSRQNSRQQRPKQLSMNRAASGESPASTSLSAAFSPANRRDMSTGQYQFTIEEEVHRRFPKNFIFDLEDVELLGTPLGSGGNGTVYKARIKSIDWMVAAKLFRDQEAVRQSIDEIQRSLKLRHQNIVQCVGIVLSHTPVSTDMFMLMELADGSLADILYSSPDAPRRLSWGACISFIREICDGLAYLHSRNPKILMLDMKPQNILYIGVGHKKTLKLCDFGLSRSAATDATRLDLSRLPGGTLRYAPPDQMRSQSVMPANDVYSFGVIIFWFVCRREPWQGANFGQIAQGKLIDTFEPVEDCPPQLAELCRRCIDPSSDNRPKDAIQLQRELNDMTFGGVLPGESGLSSSSILGASGSLVSAVDNSKRSGVEQTEYFEADYSEY